MASGIVPRQHTALAMRLLARLACSALLGCATPTAPTAPLEAALTRTPVAGGTLQVRLAFGAGADLDLYVSDPAAEAVYFANSPSRSGGALLEDLRCRHAGPRVETVRFEAPPRGRYRVGVDYASACNGAGPEPFVVEVRSGDRRLLRRGEALPGRFEVVVIEFDVP